MGVSKTYASSRGQTHALHSVDFGVRAGEFVSFVGPSGCGKSTLLHIVGGLTAASKGEVWLEEDRVLGPGAELSVVFQQHTLFPWLTVWDNIRFPQSLARNRQTRMTTAEVTRRVARAESLVQLVGLSDARDKYPGELSGGMQQRAAIARALVAQPEVLLMDEPFGALDAQTREEMQNLLLRLIEHHKTTTLFVTHDVDEAVLLSDRVVVLSSPPGQIIADIDITIPRAERSADIKLREDFLAIKRKVIDLLRSPRRSTEHHDELLRDLTQAQED